MYVLHLVFFVVIVTLTTVTPAVYAQKSGKQIYVENCFTCHGYGKGSSATRPINKLQDKYNLQTLKVKILTGGDAMPPISHLSDQQLNLVGHFVLNDLRNAQDFRSQAGNTGAKTSQVASNISPSDRHSHSITEFGFDVSNSAAMPSLISPANITLLQPDFHPELNDAMKYMPLMYRNGKTDDRTVVFGSIDGNIVAYNFDKKEVIWKTKLPTLWGEHEIPKHTLRSTPFIDLEAGKIYAFTDGWKDEDGVGQFLNNFAVLDLDRGEVEQVCPLTEAEFFNDQDINRDLWRQRVHCKTAPAVYDNNGQKTIYVGCSMRLTPNIFTYKNDIRASGGIATLKSDANGNFDQCDISFTPSSTKSDTGIYLSGGKLTLLDDGDLLVTTGNGYVDLERGDYGCSIMRMKPDLTLATNASGEYLAYSQVPTGSYECWLLNTEYTVATTALVELDNQLIGATVNKNGSMVIFKPDDFNQAGENLVEFPVGSNPNHSTPIGFKNDRGEAIFIVSFKGEDADEDNRHYGGENYYPTWVDHYLTTADNPHDAQLGSCAGYLSRDDSRKPLSLYHSGKLKDDYAVTVPDTKIAGELTSSYSEMFGAKGDFYFQQYLWAPYSHSSILGYSVDKKLARQAQANAGVELEYTRGIPLFIDGYNRPAMQGLKQYQGFHYLKITGQELSTCPDLGDGLVPIYHAHKNKRDPKRLKYDSVVAYTVDRDLNVQQLWSHSLGPKHHLSRSHIIMLDSEGEANDVVVVAAVNKNIPVRQETIFLKASNGSEVHRLDNQSVVQFSMPLAFDEVLMLPTTTGLEVFSIQ